MPDNEAFDHLVANTGNHFDKICVEAFINHYNSKATIPYLYKDSLKSITNEYDNQNFQKLRVIK
jgi:HD-GYP domain-containing protein (c-di-GMP phosphodiesterase class II)